MDWTKWANFGPNWLVTGTLLFFLFIILKWVMEFVKEQNALQAKEREAWSKKDEMNLAIVGALKSSIDLHNQQSIDAHAVLKEAGSFQRAEHEKMINNLNEITVTLGRINGYKK
jgi:hypothetical protein